MKRYLILLFLFLGSCAHDHALLNKIYHDTAAHSQAYANLKACIDLTGHRLTGSANGRKAEEFTYSLMNSYGLDTVRYLPFTVQSWQRRSLVTTLVHPDSGILRSVAMAYSPVHFADTRRLVDCRQGYRSDFDSLSAQVKDQFVLVDLGGKPKTANLHRTEKTALAREYGAAGVLFVNSVEGGILLTGTVSNTSSVIGLPAVCISLEDGARFRRWLAGGDTVSVRIDMENYAGDITARDVIGEIRGSEKPDEILIIGGHLDSWDLAQGAIDNGIGSFTVLDIARTFGALHLRPKRTILFVMYMGEEEGLLGSKALLKEYGNAGRSDRIRYVLNLDMHGNTIGIDLGGRTEARPFFDSIGKELQRFDTSYTNQMDTTAGLHSDHETFMLQGIPTLQFLSNLNPIVYRYYHSNGDTFGLVNKAHMEKAVRCVSYMLYRLADAPQLPARTLNDEATREFFIRNGLKEELMLGAKWRWKD